MSERNEEYEVEEILRYNPKTDEYMIKWKDYDEITWEPKKNLEHCKEKIQEFHNKYDNNSIKVISIDYSYGNGRIVFKNKGRRIVKSFKEGTNIHPKEVIQFLEPRFLEAIKKIK